MNSKFIPEHDKAIKPQNLGPWLMKSNFNLRSPSSYLARNYLIATVIKLYKPFLDASLYTCRGLRYRQGAEGAQILGMQLYNCNHFYNN